MPSQRLSDIGIITFADSNYCSNLAFTTGELPNNIKQTEIFHYMLREGVINTQRGGEGGSLYWIFNPSRILRKSLCLYFSSKKSLRKSLRLYFSSIKSLRKSLCLYFSSKKSLRKSLRVKIYPLANPTVRRTGPRIESG